IDNLYKNLGKIKSEPKRKMLADQEAIARLSKELATADDSVPIEIDIDSMRAKEPDREKLTGIFMDLDFKTLAKETAPDTPGLRSGACYGTITERKDFDGFLRELKKQKWFVFDFETTSENPLEAVPVGISFCWEQGKAYYVALADKGEGRNGLGREYVFDALKNIMEDENVKKTGQNIKYEKLILYNCGINLKGIDFDTMIASYLLDPSKFNHNLDDMAFERLDHKMISTDDILGTGKKRVTMDKVPLDKISEYSCEDSDMTLRLKYILEKELFEKELDRLFRDIELPLVDVLSEIEKNGVKIDVDLLGKMSVDADKELTAIVKNIYAMAGSEFNINSPKQLSEILFGKLNLPAVKKTKTGLSTDVGVLERLAFVHPLPKELLKYRELSKLKSTYIDALPELISKKTGRLHTSFNQTVTATGRLSSSKPNLQNIPIKTKQGKEIRRAFIGEKGNLIISADYSQIELRILAHLSKDEELIKAFEERLDVHTHTASLIYDVREDEVTPEQRACAKTVNFGIVYGMSAFGLSRGLSIDPASAQEFIDSYFERYPRIKLYMEDIIEEARDMGYVTTLFNRRRYIPEIISGSVREQQQAERIAINTPIQGSAADLIKIAMINIHKELMSGETAARMILQVHDELVFEVPEKEAGSIAVLVREKMESAVKLNVPIEVNVKRGRNWLELEGI
ncbi:MAG TPA: DNA polymerase I, partial [Candidatus Omnitrophica bacterium]|nr:DNA polymerase I [Candidatus Omnitrophota bacterium]